MLDTARSKWHCRVTSLFKDVIHEDVCTVGGFSCKIKALYRAMAQHERCAWKAADETKSVLFLSCIFESAVCGMKETTLSLKVSQSQSNVSGRSGYRGWGGLYYQFELVILPDIIMFQILQCSSFVHHTLSAKVKSTPLLQLISLTLRSLLFSAVGRQTVIPCLVAVLPTSRKCLLTHQCSATACVCWTCVFYVNHCPCFSNTAHGAPEMHCTRLECFSEY